LNMPEKSIFESFLAIQGSALFEYAGGGAFSPLGNPPQWYEQIWDAIPERGKTVRLAERSPFLENFLVDAEDFWKSRAEGSLNSGNWIEYAADGAETPLEASAFRIDGKRILLLRNLSSTFASQQKLFQTARDSLLAHERLLREIQKKEILLHCIVHDLTQPLNAMRGCFSLLTLEHLSGKPRQLVETGQRESNRQEQMIRGILEAFSGDLAAQEASRSDPADASDLAAAAAQVVRDLSAAFTEKGIRLLIDPALDASRDWKVVGDAPRIARVFGNLLENALRYSPKEAIVTVGLEDKGSSVLAFVDDEGPGLPKGESTNRLFALFAKGQDRPGKAGLGLYFCKITVERWGGSIGAETRAAGGSRFWFRLPRAQKAAKIQSEGKSSAAPPSAEASAQESPAVTNRPRIGKAARPLHILVADDDETSRELVHEMLKRRGHSVVGVADGREAIAALERESFDVALMDQQMPRMSGLEATRALRQKESTLGKHQFIVGLTGNTTEEDRKHGLDAGLDGYLTKPFSMELLFQTVESIASGGKPPAPAPSDPAQPDVPREDAATHLLRKTAGNEKLARSLAKSFLADSPPRLFAIRRAIAQKDAEKLATTAHLMKGALGIFGALEAVAAARSLEAMGRARNLNGAAEAFRSLEEEFARLGYELHALQPKSKTKSKSKPAPKRSPRPRRSSPRSRRKK
jgi:signal transduction histidine kinase/DNA-binding NarL/FixJ family response regulator